MAGTARVAREGVEAAAGAGGGVRLEAVVMAALAGKGVEAGAGRGARGCGVARVQMEGRAAAGERGRVGGEEGWGLEAGVGRVAGRGTEARGTEAGG